MFVVAQVHPGMQVMLSGAEGDVNQIVPGMVLRAGARVWQVTVVHARGQVGAFLTLNGTWPLNVGLELRMNGAPMQQREFARTAKLIAQIAQMLPAIDVTGFIVANAGDQTMLPMQEAAAAIAALQGGMPDARLLQSLVPPQG